MAVPEILVLETEEPESFRSWVRTARKALPVALFQALEGVAVVVVVVGNVKLVREFSLVSVRTIGVLALFAAANVQLT